MSMGKSRNSSDSLRCRIVSEELTEFNKLVKGHEKLLEAIGKL